MINVVVIDDSPFVCRLTKCILNQNGNFRVVDTATDGKKGLALIRNLRPDVVTLDVDMPGMSGLEVLDVVMHEQPTPVVLLSGVSRRAAEVTVKALQRGAVDFIPKFVPGARSDADSFERNLCEKVAVASRIKVIRSVTAGRQPSSSNQRSAGTTAADELTPSTFPIVVIGASTGGPAALREFLDRLPIDFTGAVIVVQHMAANFSKAFADQLDRTSRLSVKEAVTGDFLYPGRVLVTPGDWHLLVRPTARVELVQKEPIHGHRPSIDVTMQSVAQVFGYRAIGVVLSGMGSDGAMGLAAIHNRGGKTYAQSPENCVVASMPETAIARGVVHESGEPVKLAERVALYCQDER